jgi:lipopolysaccharide transport system permease protein
MENGCSTSQVPTYEAASIVRVTETQAPARPRSAEPVAEPQLETAREPRITVIRPAPRWPHLDLVELWHYRELLLTLTWRDIAVKYKQTAFGIGWAILQPFLTMVVFTLVFGKWANFGSKGVPYPIFSYSALLPWMYFAGAVTTSSGSLVSNKPLVTKVYFPRILLPLAGVSIPLADLLFASIVLGGMMIWFSVSPSFAILLAPIFVLLALVTALGVGLFFAAVGVRYRDVPYTIPFVLQSWMFLSGVIQPIEKFPTYAQWVLAFNPMTAVINGFQWGFLGTSAPDLGQTLVSVGSAVLFFVVGLSYFRRSEPRFADTI